MSETMTITPADVGALKPKSVHAVAAFCAQCQKETPHVAFIESNGELVLRCGCKRFIKVPRLAPDKLREHLATHMAHNKGRIPLTPEQLAAGERERQERSDYLKQLEQAGVAKVVDL